MFGFHIKDSTWLVTVRLEELFVEKKTGKSQKEKNSLIQWKQTANNNVFVLCTLVFSSFPLF